jgi:hypothetical protein
MVLQGAVYRAWQGGVWRGSIQLEKSRSICGSRVSISHMKRKGN